MLSYDPEFLPLSYLSQVDYCPRRAALLLNERVWAENADTAKGRAEHERVHTRRVERRGSQAKLYEYSVFSSVLCVSGKCDLIEAEEDSSGCQIPVVPFPVRLYPVEFKHGNLRDEREYKIQLCAQAMCLEEMYHAVIPEGALFYISSHRRQTVSLDTQLRSMVLDRAKRLHQIRKSMTIPAPEPSAKCKRCSLSEICMPHIGRSAESYCRQLIRDAQEVEPL